MPGFTPLLESNRPRGSPAHPTASCLRSNPPWRRSHGSRLIVPRCVHSRPILAADHPKLPLLRPPSLPVSVTVWASGRASERRERVRGRQRKEQRKEREKPLLRTANHNVILLPISMSHDRILCICPRNLLRLHDSRWIYLLLLLRFESNA